MKNEGKSYIQFIDFFFMCVTHLLIELTKKEALSSIQGLIKTLTIQKIVSNCDCTLVICGQKKLHVK